MKIETLLQLLAPIFIALVGSQGFWEYIKAKKGISNKSIIDKIDENEANQARWRVLQFNTEILRGWRHSREEFIDALLMIDRYENYCKEHPNYQNNRAELAIDNIKRIYAKCMEENSFL